MRPGSFRDLDDEVELFAGRHPDPHLGTGLVVGGTCIVGIGREWLVGNFSAARWKGNELSQRL